MKDNTFSGMKQILFINVLHYFKQAYHLSQAHHGAAFWFFRDCMTGPALSAIKAHLTISSNDVSTNRLTTKSCAEVFNHLLRRYETNTVIAKLDAEI